MSTILETLLSLLLTLAMAGVAIGAFLACELDRREREMREEDRQAAARDRANAHDPEETDHV